MANFMKAHRFTAKWEGGLADHPDDPGGVTNHGVSLRWLRARGAGIGDIDGDGDIDADDVRALTPKEAAALFKREFWDPCRLDGLPQLVATCHYDCMVNAGPTQAARIAQRACSGLGIRLVMDGVFGERTRAALKAYSSPRLANAMLDARIRFYRRLVDKRPELAVFKAGWLNRVADLRRFLGLGQ